MAIYEFGLLLMLFVLALNAYMQCHSGNFCQPLFGNTVIVFGVHVETMHVFVCAPFIFNAVDYD